MSMPEHEAEVTIRPMTEEEIKKYGAPLRQTCTVCGRELPLNQFEFIVPGVEREQMILDNSCRQRRDICKECEKKQGKRRKKSHRGVPQALRPVIRDDGQRYATARSAAENTGITLDHLLACLRGRHKRAGGHGWRWATAKEVKNHASS